MGWDCWGFQGHIFERVGKLVETWCFMSAKKQTLLQENLRNLRWQNKKKTWEQNSRIWKYIWWKNGIQLPANPFLDGTRDHWLMSKAPINIRWGHPPLFEVPLVLTSNTSAMIDDILFGVVSTWFYPCPKVWQASPNCFGSSRLKTHPEY